jgi:hypothetical protein
VAASGAVADHVGWYRDPDMIWEWEPAAVDVPILARPDVRDASAVLPNSRLVLYPQDGHLLLLQHWEDLLTAVTAGALTKEPAAGQQEHGGRAAPQ